MAKQSPEKRLVAIEKRLADLEANHGDEITQNAFIRVAARDVIGEMKWLAAEVRRLQAAAYAATQTAGVEEPEEEELAEV